MLKSVRNQTVTLNINSPMTVNQVANSNIEVPIYSAAWPQYGLKTLVVEIKLWD